MGCIMSLPCPEKIKPACDGLRETPIRFLGYGTHVGNACSGILPPSLANIPHMITTAYIATDVFDKALKSAEAVDSRRTILVKTFDAVIWQALATIILPGFIINKVKSFAVDATKYQPTSCSPPPPLVKALPPSIVRALPCILGILTLPLIMYPIDKAVTMFMDYTYRPMFEVSKPVEKKKVIKKQAA